MDDIDEFWYSAVNITNIRCVLTWRRTVVYQVCRLMYRPTARIFVGGGGGGGRMSGSGAKCRVGRWVWGYTPQKILKNGLSEAAFRAF